MQKLKHPFIMSIYYAFQTQSAPCVLSRLTPVEPIVCVSLPASVRPSACLPVCLSACVCVDACTFARVRARICVRACLNARVRAGASIRLRTWVRGTSHGQDGTADTFPLRNFHWETSRSEARWLQLNFTS